MPARRATSRSRPALAVACLGAATLAGCTSPPPAGPVGSETLMDLPAGAVDPLALQADLFAYANLFSAEVAGTASTIAAESTDRRHREMTVRWKLVAIPAVQRAVLSPDPRMGLIGAWSLTAEMRSYFEGAGADVFGAQTLEALEVTRALEASIVATARRHLPAEAIDATTREIEAFVDAYPIAAMFNQQLDLPEEIMSVGEAVLSVPLLPFQALGGIGSTPAEIRRVTVAARALGGIVQDLPERVRWQAELLMLELDSIPTLVALRESADRIGASAITVADRLDALPEDLEAQIEVVLDRLAEDQAELRASIEQATRLSESAGTTAEAWGETVRALDALAATIADMQERAAAKPPSDAPPFDPNDYAAAAVELRRAAEDVRALLGDVQGADLAPLVDASGATVDRAAMRLDELVGALTVRALLVVGAALAGLLVVLVVAKRVPARTA